MHADDQIASADEHDHEDVVEDVSFDSVVLTREVLCHFAHGIQKESGNRGLEESGLGEEGKVDKVEEWEEQEHFQTPRTEEEGTFRRSDNFTDSVESKKQHVETAHVPET